MLSASGAEIANAVLPLSEPSAATLNFETESAVV